MRANLVTAPSIEPITLAEAKLHLRVDAGDFASNIDQTPSFHPASYTVHDEWTSNVGDSVEVLGYTAVVEFSAGINLTTGTVDMRIQEADVLGTWTAWGTDFTQVAAEGALTSAALAIGTTNTAVANGAFTYSIAGTTYSKAADAVGTAPGNDVVPEDKYGAVAFDIGTDGTIHVIEAAANGTTGYTTAALAIAGLAAVAASHVRMGTVTAMKSDGAFTFGTTALSATNATVAYTSQVSDEATYEKAYTGTKRYIRTAAKVLVDSCTFGTTIIRLTATSLEDDLLNAIITASREHVEDITGRALLTQTWDYFLQDWPASDSIKLPFGNLASVTSIKWKDTEGTETNLTKAITVFAASSVSPTTKTKVTSTAHGFSDADSVFITGTTSYNGSWTISNTATNTFDITTAFVADDATGTAATAYIVETNGEQCGRIVLPYGDTWPSGTLYSSNPITIRFICGWTTAALVPYKIKAACKLLAADLYEQRGEPVVGQTVSENKTAARLLGSARLFDEF